MHPASQHHEPQPQQQKKERQSSPEGTHLLPTHERPHQPQLKLLDDRRQLLGQLSGSKPAVVVLYAVLVLVLVYILGRRSHDSHYSSTSSSGVPASSSQGTAQLLRLGPGSSSAAGGLTYVAGSSSASYGATMYNSGSSSSFSSSSTLNVRCPYGSLPGTWVSSAPAGSRWQLLDSDCHLTNWLAAYEAAAGHTSSSSALVSSGGVGVGLQESSSEESSSSASIERLAERYAPADALAAESSSSSSSSGSSDDSSSSSLQERTDSTPQPPAVRVLLLSDSVDRYIVQHVCEALGGIKQTHMMKSTPAAEAAEEAAAAAAAAAAGTTADAPLTPPPLLAATPPAEGAAAPTLLNKTAYAFHTCESVAPIKLASSYFPGVHPTGPFHRFSAQDYTQRIDSARQMWAEYAGTGPGSEPQLVSVASLLWDVARLYMHERQRMEGVQELDKALLDGWVANFTDVVQYAQQAFPQVRTWVEWVRS
jgi:hypothetical protein